MAQTLRDTTKRFGFSKRVAKVLIVVMSSMAGIFLVEGLHILSLAR